MKKERIIQSIVKDFFKIISFFKQLPWIAGNNSFLAIIFLLIFNIIIGSYFFYCYIYTAQQQIPILNQKQIVIFDQKKYQQVLDYWQEQDKNINGAFGQNLKNPFK